MDNINYIYIINYFAVLIGFVSRSMLRQLSRSTVAIIKKYMNNTGKGSLGLFELEDKIFKLHSYDLCCK